MKRPICLSLILLGMALAPSARADRFSWGVGLGYGGIGLSGCYAGSHVSIPFSLTFPYSYYTPIYTPPPAVIGYPAPAPSTYYYRPYPYYGSYYYTSPYSYGYAYRYPYGYDSYYRYPYGYNYFPSYRHHDSRRDRDGHDRDNWRGRDRDHRRDGGDSYRRDGGRDSGRGRDAIRYDQRSYSRGGYQVDSRGVGSRYSGFDSSRSGRSLNAGSAYRSSGGAGAFGKPARGGYGQAGGRAAFRGGSQSRGTGRAGR